MREASWSKGPGVPEEVKRVARVLDIIVRVGSRPRMWTRRALSQAFEISERRVQEDLDIIVHRLRFPLRHSRSGYYFTESHSLPAVTFGFGEAAALLLAATVGKSTAGVGSAELAAALVRLREAFPVELRDLLETLALSSQTGDGSDRLRGQAAEILQEAIATRTTVEMAYATASRADETSHRDVDPYALIPYVRSLHVVGYCHMRKEIRIFKVDRIRSVRLTGRSFEKPNDFDVDTFLGESWGLMRGASREPECVQIRFTSRAGRWVSEERWHPSQKAEWQEDGSMVFSMRVGVTPALVRWILYYGCDARVVKPEWLAEEVRKAAAAIVDRYDLASGGGRE